MRLHEFTSADEQLELLHLVIGSALQSINDQYRREIAHDMESRVADDENVPLPKAVQNIEPETKNIEVSLRPQPLTGASTRGSFTL